VALNVNATIVHGRSAGPRSPQGGGSSGQTALEGCGTVPGAVADKAAEVARSEAAPDGSRLCGFDPRISEWSTVAEAPRSLTHSHPSKRQTTIKATPLSSSWQVTPFGTLPRCLTVLPH